ncbi:MAG: 4-hydroxy-tetrahydrodipicolinate synthase [Clostridia bacterium]|nr:4-hydroxy-tetrahydrodipicolinate synthase [Clostridia bacterium]
MKKLNFPLFDGVATALLTPFSEDGSIDEDSFERMVLRQIDSGISALVVAGTTGEGTTLSDKEKCRLTSLAKDLCTGKIPVYGNCGANDTEKAVSLAKKLTRAGADGLLSVTPYYNKATRRGLYLHYKAIASATDTPLMVYHVPTRTGCRMTIENYADLSELDTLVAVKEASGELRLLSDLLEDFGERYAVYAGNDEDALFARRLGSPGCVSVLSNLLPEDCVRLQALCRIGDWSAARSLEKELLPKMQAMFREVNPVPAKYVASRIGLCKPSWRLPMCEPSKETAAELDDLFKL